MVLLGQTGPTVPARAFRRTASSRGRARDGLSVAGAADFSESGADVSNVLGAVASLVPCQPPQPARTRWVST